MHPALCEFFGAPARSSEGNDKLENDVTFRQTGKKIAAFQPGLFLFSYNRSVLIAFDYLLLFT